MQDSMFTLQTIELLMLGAGLGFFGGLFGIGGGIIAIPVLAMGFGMPQAMTQGTVLVMMVPNLLVSWWQYSRRHPIALSTMLKIGGVACVSTWLVAHAATSVNQSILHVIFNGFLLLLAMRLFLLRTNPTQNMSPAHPPLAPRFMPWVGVIGGGLVATPLFTRWFGQKQVAAQGLSLALVAPSSLIALLSYNSAQKVDWHIGIALAIGGILTVSIGVATAHRLPEAKMRGLFAVMLLVTALWSLVRMGFGA